MDDDDVNMIGNDPLVDGMLITLRYRRDMLVTDAAQVLAAGRRAFLDLHPDATEQDAEQHIDCAAQAVYALLDRDGLVGKQDSVGLANRGYRQQLTFNEQLPISVPANCFDGDVDMFALPPSDLA